MSKEEELKKLVDSLTPIEKKSLRIELNKFREEDSNKKSILFDYYNNKNTSIKDLQKSYNDYNYSYRYIAADRYKLYQTILEALTLYHQNYSSQVALHQEYQKAYILFEKRLFQQAQKQLLTTEKKAIKYENYTLLISICQLKQRFLKITEGIPAALKALEESLTWVKKLQELNAYIQLHYESISFRVSLAKARTIENIHQLEHFIEQPLLKNVPKEQGFFIQFHYWETLCNYFFIKNEVEKELTANQEIIKLFDHFDWIKKDEPLNYLIIHTRILAIKKNLYPEDFLANLSVYKQLQTNFKKQRKEAESIIFIFGHNYELDYYIQNQKWNLGIQFLPSISKGLQYYQNQIEAPLRLTAYYRIAIIYFFAKDYNAALTYLHHVLHDFPASTRPDVYSFSLLIEIIIHLELQNYRLLPHLIKTASYFIKKRNRLFLLEKITLSYLKKAALVKNQIPNKQAEIKRALQSEINNILITNPKEKIALSIFNFLHWLDSSLKTG